MNEVKEVAAQPAACCGGPAPEACCVEDADAKAAGQTGCGCQTAQQTGATSCCGPT